MPVKAPVVKKLKLKDIELADYNPREISDVALKGLGESLSRYGLLELPVVNVAGKKLRCVSGHQRIRQLRSSGYVHADCVVVEFSDADERMANVAMNNPATQGHWNPASALEHMGAIMAELPRPDVAGFVQLQEEIRAQLPKPEAIKASDDTIEPPEQPKSEPDTFYQLGRHRLYCGDALEPGAMLDLVGTKKVHACITDPPYNVDYQDGAIANDDMDEDAWKLFLTATCKIILKVVRGPCYVFMASKQIPCLWESWRMNGGEVHRWLVWVKDRFTLGRSDYQHQYEPIMYGGRAGVVLAKPSGVSTNVLEFPKPSVNTFHPTQKPVELIRALVETATKDKQRILDPFGGSGTTLVAAEELGRTCLMAEISPGFCDTIRQRWAEQVHGAGVGWEDLTPALDVA